MDRMTIAIDGPAASGKSTTAKRIAQNLGYLYIDTGAMYRAVTLAVLDAKIDIKNEAAIAQLADKIVITLEGQRTLLDGRDISEAIRQPEITSVISVISAHPSLREIMVRKQQEMAADGGVVMDGRDIGTVVLPDADVKIYMLATVAERARRRFDELVSKGVTMNMEDIKQDILKRDRIDSERDIAPLKPAVDAIIIDTTSMTVDQQVAKVMQVIDIRVREQNNIRIKENG
jgi:cytidylate kinase